MGKLHRIGKFYTRIMMRNIGMFIFIGILFVVFHERGWFPNKNIYAISQYVYQYAIPLMISYEGGRLLGGPEGGILGVIAECGFLTAGSMGGILGAMLLGPASGWCIGMERRLWNRLQERGNENSRFAVGWKSMTMLRKNLAMAFTGAGLAVLGFYGLAPALAMITSFLSCGMESLIEHGAVIALSVFIEPMKVFFMNNLLHHAILAPLGLEQVKELGGSLLFLLEANPGPGFGVLAALYFRKPERKDEYASALAVHLLGGIHEVYFPYALSNPWLLLPLVAGGMAGNLSFALLGAKATSVVSPGSLIILILLANKDMLLPILAGVAVSAGVSFLLSLWVVSTKEKKERGRQPMEREENKEPKEPEEKKKVVERIAFVCDGGMGSSAMGAAILRRMLREKGMAEILVQAYAVDLVPESETFLVCQRDFYPHLPKKEKAKEVRLVDSLVRSECFAPLADEIQERNRASK